MRTKKGVLKGCTKEHMHTQHEGMHLHPRDTTFPPLEKQGVLRNGERTSARRWAWGSIGLDAGNMGGGESVVGIASKQVSSGFDGVNHSEWADPLAHEGFSETTPPDWGVNKDFGGINISRGNSTQVVVPLLALLCNL